MARDLTRDMADAMQSRDLKALRALIIKLHLELIAARGELGGLRAAEDSRKRGQRERQQRSRLSREVTSGHVTANEGPQGPSRDVTPSTVTSQQGPSPLSSPYKNPSLPPTPKNKSGGRAKRRTADDKDARIAEALELLAGIAALATESRGAAGSVRVIRATDVREQFDDVIATAFAHFGGSGRLVNSAAEDRGFLARDFAAALHRVRTTDADREVAAAIPTATTPTPAESGAEDTYAPADSDRAGSVACD